MGRRAALTFAASVFVLAVFVSSTVACGSLSPFGVQVAQEESIDTQHPDELAAPQITHNDVLGTFLETGSMQDVTITTTSAIASEADFIESCTFVQLRPLALEFSVAAGSTFNDEIGCGAIMTLRGIGSENVFYSNSDLLDSTSPDQWQRAAMNPDMAEITIDALEGMSGLGDALSQAGPPEKVYESTAIYWIPQVTVGESVIGYEGRWLGDVIWDVETLVPVSITLDGVGHVSEYSFRVDLLEQGNTKVSYETTRILTYDPVTIDAPARSRQRMQVPASAAELMFLMGL